MSEDIVPAEEFGGGLFPKLTDKQKGELQEFEGKGMAEELANLPITFPRIDIVHGGNAAFNFVDEDDIVKEFQAILIHVESQRAYWPTKYGEGGEEDKMPVCYSRDLIKPDPQAEAIQHETCANCPMNQWGSDTKKDGSAARGKACKEIRRVFMLPAGRLSPYYMPISPANLKPLGKYFQTSRNKGIQKVQSIVTLFSAKNVSNKDGVTYTELALAVGGTIPDNVAYAILEFKRKIEEMLSTAAPITKDEYEGKDKGKAKASKDKK